VTATTPPILEFAAVTVEADPLYDSGIWNINLTLAPGELLLVRLERGHLRLPLADAAGGLVEPTEGQIRFGGVDWASLSATKADRLRGHIGRVFDPETGTHNWISNLDVDENVMLAQRHHTKRKDSEIADDASRLARTFGLPGLPRGRPVSSRRADLLRAGLVRAFLGKPDLILLERPTDAGSADLLAQVANAVRSARARGAAVLWVTAETAVWNNAGLRPTWKGAMSGAQLLCTRETQSSGPADLQENRTTAE
jgi:phospholipid/cholesterol/gamma-HCH transport system ATP-binding protein